MLIKWTIIALSSALVLGAASGCGSAGVSARKIKLLTTEAWQYEKAGFYTNDEDEEDVRFDALDPRIAGCEKDDRIVFRSDGTGILEEGKVKCKVDSDNLPFVWSFQNNDSTIYFQDRYYKVKTLTDRRFVIYTDEKYGDIKTRYTIVMRH